MSTLQRGPLAFFFCARACVSRTQSPQTHDRIAPSAHRQPSGMVCRATTAGHAQRTCALRHLASHSSARRCRPRGHLSIGPQLAPLPRARSLAPHRRRRQRRASSRPERRLRPRQARYRQGMEALEIRHVRVTAGRHRPRAARSPAPRRTDSCLGGASDSLDETRCSRTADSAPNHCGRAGQ